MLMSGTELKFSDSRRFGPLSSNIQVDVMTKILSLFSVVLSVRSLSFTRAFNLERNLAKKPVRPLFKDCWQISFFPNFK